MYLVKVTAKESLIDGKGVFTLQDIKQGDIVWKFEPTHDKTLSSEEFDALKDEEKKSIRRVAYLSESTKRLVYPPENDPALYTNHSEKNNLSAVLNKSISEEPVFIANRDIFIGEELTNNYREFDDISGDLEAGWLK